ADSAMPDLHAVAYTLQVGREAHACRHAMVCDSIEGAITALDQCESLLPQEMPEPGRVAQGKPVVFMFPGQGSQYVGMTAGLYEQEPLFRELIDYCVTRLEAESIPDLRKLMFAQGSEQEQARAQLQQTRYAQPALFVVQYALARLWMSFGVRPAAMIGHSVGEYVAACLAGVFSLDDGLTLIAARARLMQSAPAGKMLSVHATADTLKPILAAMAEGRATDGGSGGDIPEFAAINSPQNCVLSGSFAAIEQVQARLDALKITHAGLRTSHAFHSSMMDDMLDSYRQVLEQVVLRAPQLDYISNLDGLPVDPAQVIRPDYWLRHLRQCVAFSDGIRTLLADEAKILLEVGPGRTLASLVRKHAGAGQHTVLCSMRHEQDASPDQNVLLQTLGQLWQNGVGIDWAGFHARNRCRRIALPGYVFERESYWIEAGSSASPAQIDTSQPQNWLYTAQWQKQPVSRQLASTLPPQVWLIVHEAQGGLGRLLAQRLRNQGQVVIDVFAGTAFAQTATHSYQVQWQQRGDFDALLAALVQQQCVPQRVLHLAGLPDPVPGVAGLSAHYSEAEFAVSQSGPCLSVLYLAQALARMQQAAATDAATEAATAKDHPPSAIATATAPDKAHRRGAAQPPLEFNLVSVGQASVSGAETLLPDAATAIGLASAIRAECPQLNLLHIDLDSGFEPERTAERIVAEVSAQQRQPWLALRGHGRWIRHFAQHASEQVENGNSRLKPGAVVLITGGMGRVGLHLAQLLATRVQARLVLTGRTAVPPRQQWHALQAEGNPEGLLVQQLMALEAAGASLLLCQADCADLAQMRAVWQQAEAAFGRIDGVIHAAAELGTALTPFDQVNALHLHQQAHAKIRGVLVLEALLQEKSPDFCLLLSSMLTLLGSSGLAAYTAANSFMDVFVQNKQAQGDERWLILNSDWWDFIGNGGNEQVFTLAEASALVARLLALPQAAPLYLSRQDLNQRLTRGPLERKTRKERKKTAPAKGGSREHIAPSSPVEATLVGIWQELIGIEQIGVRDNFFDIGGDSLLATRLISMVHEQFGTGKNDLSLKMLFDQPYIENLAQAISDSAERRKLAQTRSSLGEMAESDVEEGEI
ncbi:MAG: hypothetical protein RL748_1871, partial [Pseudomonadota bacterium]